MSDALIAQIVDRIPTLSEDQIQALNSVETSQFVDEMIKAIETPGIEEKTALVMQQLGTETDPGVWAIARIAVLGILVNSDVLKRAWEDVVEPFHAETFAEIAQEEVVEVKEGLTEETLPPTVEVPVTPPDEVIPPVVEPSEPVTETPVTPQVQTSVPVAEQIIDPNAQEATPPSADPSAGAI